MKQIFTFARNVMISLGLTLAVTANAEVLIDENFDAYTAGNLIGQGSWEKKGSHTNDPIQVVSEQLTYSDYANAVAGNGIRLFTASTSGEDAKLPLSQPFALNDDASVYVSLLIKVNSVNTTTEKPNVTAFLTGLSGSTGNSDNGFHLHALPGSADGKIKFAVGRSEINTKQDNVTITTEEYDANTTYLVVIKYTRRAEATNDEVALFINPALDAEPPVANALYNGTSGSEITTHGLAAIQLKQHSTFNKACIDVNIDAIKAVTDWADLKTVGGGTTEPIVNPVINVTPSQLNIEELILSNAEPQSYTLKVTATDLQGDINVSLSGANAQSVTVAPDIIAKADIETAGEAEITLTINPTGTEGTQSCNINFTTDGQNAPTSVVVNWSVLKVFDNLAAFAEAGTAAYGSIATEVVVSAIENTPDGINAYVQDETKAMKISLSVLDDALVSQFVEGAHFTGMVLSENTEIYCFTATASSNNGILPITLTLPDLITPAPENIYRLIKLKNMKFETSETIFDTKQITIKNGDNTINVRAIAGSDLIGTDIPSSDKSFNIIGILTPGLMGTYYIQLRSLKDIEEIDTPTGITHTESKMRMWSNSGALYIESDKEASITIYTVTGQRIADAVIKQGITPIALANGVYIVKTDSSASKVSIK